MVHQEIAEKFNNLSDEDNRLLSLQELKDSLSQISQEEVSQTAGSLPILFDCLNTSNSEEVDLACDILTLCMHSLSIGESTSRYSVLLERALKHTNPAAKLMALNEIERNLADRAVVENESLLATLVFCLADEDLGVASRTSAILTKLGTTEPGLQKLCTHAVQQLIEGVLSDVIRLRVYETLIAICVKSEVSFAQLNAMGLLNRICADLDNNDVLLRLNVIELLGELGRTKSGFDYLESTGVFDNLFSCVDRNDAIELHLCEPGIIKFFGAVANWKPQQVMSKYYKMLNRVTSHICADETDDTLLGVSIDTISVIGSSQMGKIALRDQCNDFENTIRVLGRRLAMYSTEVKIRALHCLESLFEFRDVLVTNGTEGTGRPMDNQISELVLQWFKLLGDDNRSDSAMQLVWNNCRNPFADIRVAALNVLRAIAGHFWSQPLIRDTAGLVEFLLDRNIETAKECKEAKFSIVERIVENVPDDVFNQSTCRLMTQHVRDGPFYVQPITEISIESNE